MNQPSAAAAAAASAEIERQLQITTLGLCIYRWRCLNLTADTKSLRQVSRYSPVYQSPVVCNGLMT